MVYQRKGRRRRSATARQDHTAVCPAHRKRAYANRADARRAARISGGAGAREFRCNAIDGAWHWGHLPAAVRRGRMTIADFRRAAEEGAAA
jgi:hypothetical protein